MTTRSLFRASLLTLLVALVSCSDATVPTAPLSVPSAGVAPTPEPAQPPPAPTPPAIISVDVTGARVFRFVSPLPQLPVSWYTGGSRYVLYPDGAFVLEYPHVVYRGTYTEAGGRITFEWEGWSVMGPWGAVGVRTGDLLEVSYNGVMRLSDFEDAIYLRVPTPVGAQGTTLSGR